MSLGAEPPAQRWALSSILALAVALALGGALGSSLAGPPPSAWEGGLGGASSPRLLVGLGVCAATLLLASARGRQGCAIDLTKGLALIACALLSGLRAAAGRAPLPTEASRLEVRGEFGDDVLLAPREARESLTPWRTPRGVVADGDVALALSEGSSTALPRGPLPGPASRSGRTAADLRFAVDEWVRAGTKSHDVWERAGRLTRSLRERASARFAMLGDPVAAALCASISLGIRPSEGSRVDTDLFTRTGTRHLLAVSGLHVGILLVLLLRPLARASHALLTWLARGNLGASWRGSASARGVDTLSILLLASFVALAGARPPVQRAGLAVACAVLVARLRVSDPRARRLGLRRRLDPLAAWGTALAVECAVRPGAALDLSVQLSYGATLGLIACTRPLSGPLRVALHVERVGRTGLPRASFWQRPLERLGRLGADGLAASLAATCATLPFVWSSFGELSPWGILVTPACLPLFAVLLAASFAFLALPCAFTATVANHLAHALLAGLELVDRLPSTPLSLPPRPFVLLLAAGALATLAAAGARSARRPAALAWGLLLLPWNAAPRGIELHALDVGHGTSVALRAPGEPALVFDAGSRDRPRVAEEALLPLLRAWDPSSVRVVSSHTDRDHCGALPRVAGRFPLVEWVGAPPPAEALSPRELSALRRSLVDLESPGWLTLRASRGTLRCMLGRGSSAADNEGSRDLWVEAGASFAGLLCGDAEEEGRRRLTETLPVAADTRAHLVLLPHHGTAQAGLGALLDRLRPGEVWISRSEDPPASGEVERRGLKWRCTSRDGPLTWNEARGP